MKNSVDKENGTRAGWAGPAAGVTPHSDDGRNMQGMSVASAVLECFLWAIRRSTALSFLLASTTTPNQATWDNILADMAGYNVPRSVMPIRALWKTKKVAFHRDRAYREVHSSPRCPAGHLPANAPVVVFHGLPDLQR